MAKKTRTDEIEGYDAGNYLAGIGGAAASGAAAGSTFGVPGALIGAGVGGLVGAFNTYEQEQAYLEAQRQQLALNKDLQSSDVYDRMMQQEGLLNAASRDQALVDARTAAARAGLSPAAAIALERSTARGVAADQAAQRPGLFLAAQQADLARRQQVLSEYEAAQNLANNARPPDYSELFGQVAGAVGQVGAMTAPERAAAAAARQKSIEEQALARTIGPADGIYPTGVPSLFGPGLAGPMTSEQAAIWGGPQTDIPVTPAPLPPGLVAPLTGEQLAVGWGQQPSASPSPAPSPGTVPGTAGTPPTAAPAQPAAPKPRPVSAARPSPVSAPVTGSVTGPVPGPIQPPDASSSVVEVEGFGKVSKRLVDAAAAGDASVLLEGFTTEDRGIEDEYDPTRFFFYRDPFSNPYGVR